MAMNPFKIMQFMSNPQKLITGELQNRLQAQMNTMAQRNPQVFQKMQEMTNGKSESELKQTAMNLANEQGIDLKAFAENFGINL